MTEQQELILKNAMIAHIVDRCFVHRIKRKSVKVLATYTLEQLANYYAKKIK